MKRVLQAARKLRDHPGIVAGLGGTFPDGRMRVHVRDLKAHDVLDGTKARVLSVGHDVHEVMWFVKVAYEGGPREQAHTDVHTWHGAALVTIMPRDEEVTA